MAKPKKDIFTLTLPVRVTPEQERCVLISIDAGRQVYNATLGESLKRLDEMRRDKRWKDACKMAKGKARNNAFKSLAEYYGYTRNAIEAYGTRIRHTPHLKNHINAAVSQSFANRAFDTTQDYQFGTKGRPRFRGKNRLRSMQGKSNASGIIFKYDHIKVGNMVMPVIYDGRRKEREHQKEMLVKRTKEGVIYRKVSYCRLIHKKVKGKRRWYVQVMLEGKAPVKEKYQKRFEQAEGKTVGLDFGPSRLAIVSETINAYILMAEGIQHPWQEIRRLQREMDRSRRATNPQNYDEKGSIKKGIKLVWHKSNNYLKLQKEYQEIERKLTATRLTSHGQLANTIRSLGDQIYTEDVSHRGWQKMFGRSAKVRASGLLQTLINRKAESAGGNVVMINTRRTRLSQYCHMRDDYIKKTLSERQHVFPNGNTVQRDIYSAFLATCVENDVLDTSKVKASWQVVDSHLGYAVSTQRKLVKELSQVSGKEKKVHTKVFQTSCDTSLSCLSGDGSMGEEYKGIPVL